MLIAYVGPFTFPSSNANSLRVKGVVEALVQDPHEVMVCPGLLAMDPAGDVQMPSGVQIHQLNEYVAGFCSTLPAGLRGLFLGDVTVRWLENLQSKPDVIILYGTHLGYLIRLLRYCRRESVRLILDVVEWYDPRHLSGGLLGPFALSNELSMRWAVPRADGLLVISSYLENYYRAKGCSTLRVPPLFSEFPIRPPQLHEKNELLNLCYAGTPGKKEEFALLLEAVRRALAGGGRLKLHVIGIAEAAFLAKFPEAATLMVEHNGALELHGRLSNQATRRLVAASDFLLIARRPLRFANAGFPFKIAESMALGTPVITNTFSDISHYLKDKKNSILVKELNSQSFFEGIITALALDDSAKFSMQTNSRLTAQKYFSTSKRSDIQNFLIRG